MYTVYGGIMLNKSSIEQSLIADEEFHSQFSLWDAPVGNRDSCIHNLGLEICVDKYNNHDFLCTCLIEGIGHSLFGYDLKSQQVMRLATIPFTGQEETQVWLPSTCKFCSWESENRSLVVQWASEKLT